MYADSLLKNPQSPEEVWAAATHEQKALFRDAGTQVGLTQQEYREFLADLLDGKAIYVSLPRRVDAMAGSHHGRIYAVKNAVIEGREVGWRVRLRDGADVFIPKRCANISVLRHPVLARVPNAFAPARVYPAKVETVVTFAPPSDVPAQAFQAASIAAAPPVAGPFCWWCFTPLGFLGLIHSHPTAPPCNQGSNAAGVCSTK